MQEVQKVQEVVTRTLDEERSCLVPVWITSTGKEKNSNMDCFNREREVDNDEQLHVLYGLPQQGKRSPGCSAQMLQEENNWSRL